MAPRLMFSVLFATAALAQSASDKEIFEKVCGSCHSVALISDQKSLPEWQETVDAMIERGAKVNAAARSAVMRWLAHNYTRININQAPAEEIVEVLNIPVAEARNIIARRPYRSLAELLSRNPMSAKELEDDKDRIAFR